MAGEDIFFTGASMAPEGLLALMGAFFAVFLIIGIALYIYMGFAFMAIGKKVGLATPGLAWIPGIGPMIIAYQASKMHWWPWLLLIGLFIPFINFIASIIITVFFIIWLWKTFEAINKPGWWAILMIIPVVGWILIGIAAWSK